MDTHPPFFTNLLAIKDHFNLIVPISGVNQPGKTPYNWNIYKGNLTVLFCIAFVEIHKLIKR